jgi:transposase
MPKSVDSVLRGRVAQLVRLNYSTYRIAKETNKKHSTVKDWVRACKENEERFLAGPHYSHLGNPKFSNRERKDMTAFMEHQEVSTRDASAALSGSRHTGGKAVSRKTCGRLARKAGLHPYIPQKRPKLTPEHKRERFAFAKNNRDAEFSTWNFNDQFKIKCPLQYAVRRVWRKNRSQVPPIPTKKFAPTLNVHASLTRHGTVPLVFFDAPMNSAKFEEVNEQLIPTLTAAYEGHEFRYAHDRAPWFTSNRTQRYFAEDTPSSVIAVSPTEFPPNSPDVNLAETAMANVLKKLAKRKPKPQTKEEVRAALIEEWGSYSADECGKLYDSMSARLRDIRAKKGGNTEW